MRTWATKLPPPSATAMFIGCPISTDFFSAAAITRRASANVTMILSVLKLEFLLDPRLEVSYDLRLSQYTSNGLGSDCARATPSATRSWAQRVSLFAPERIQLAVPRK